jgi:hypothetical protein
MARGCMHPVQGRAGRCGGGRLGLDIREARRGAVERVHGGEDWCWCWCWIKLRLINPTAGAREAKAGQVIN